MNISKQAIEANDEDVDKLAGVMYVAAGGEDWQKASTWAKNFWKNIACVAFGSLAKKSAQSTATVEPKPDDVERVARAMFEQHGRKCSWKVGWDGQEEGTKDAYREQAAAAIVAMNGQLLGVWWKQGKAEGWWHGKNGKPVNTSDKVLLDEFVYTLARELSAAGAKTTFEVRPYTSPREKPATQLIAENIVIKHNCQHVPGLAESIAESLESEKRGTAKCG